MTKTNSKPMSRRMATLHQFADTVSAYVKTPEGQQSTRRLPRVSQGRSLRARRSSLDTQVRFWASPEYLKALKEIAMAFEVFSGVCPSQGVIMRRALAVYAERLAEASKDRDAMHAEARALGQHAKAA